MNFRRLCLKSEAVRNEYIEKLKTSYIESDTLESETLLESPASIDHEDDICNAEFNTLCDNEDETDSVQKVITTNTNEISAINNQLTTNNTSKFKHKRHDSHLKVKKLNRNCKAISRNDYKVKYYVPNKKDRSCVFCNNTFSKYSTLVNHIRSIHTFEKCFKCNICSEGFTNSEILARHKNRHTGERKYVCSYCGKKYFTNSDLNHHIQRHLNKRNYKCDICENKSFNTANSLRTHKLVVHTNPNEWKYLCTICGRKCVTQTALTIHIKRHSKEKDFCCHLCSKKFCTKSELSKHISSHSNMRLHKCNVCNQEYKDRKVMERHLTKKHGVGNAKIVERVKKYFCDVCPKKFVGKKQLEKHVRSHNGEKPFKCELCEQAFICNSYIKSHMKSKHSLAVLTE